MSAWTEVSARKWVPSRGTWLAAYEAKEPHTLVSQAILPFDTTQITSKGNYSRPKPGDPCHPLAAGAHPPSVAYSFRNDAARDGEAKTPSPDAIPRRLTPRECERLQGFPDDWTRWGRTEDGERVELADTPRYRALGNAVSVPVAAWIGARIADAEGAA